MQAAVDISATPSQRVLRWVKPPQQERTRQTLGRLLDAAEAMVADRGFDETSIADIAAAAGSSVGGFYRRFRDKDGLLQALHERFCEEARATADEALDPARWSGAPASEVVTQFTAFLVGIYRERAGLFRAFLHRSIVEPSVLQRQEELFEYLAMGLSAVLSDRLDPVRHPDPEFAVRFSLRVLLGTLDETYALRSRDLELTDERTATEMTRVVTSYLGVDTP